MATRRPQSEPLARPITRQQAKERTRQRILTAAKQQFIERGYDQTTIRDVARASGVAVGSVPAHFVDKAALLRACLYDDIAQAVSKAWRTLDARQSLIDQLCHCAQTLYDGYAKHPELSRAMLAETLFSKPGDAPDELLTPFLERVDELLRQAAERGELSLSEGQSASLSEVYFSLYMMVLFGGLNGSFGTSRSAAGRARKWTQKLRALLDVTIHMEPVAQRSN